MNTNIVSRIGGKSKQAGFTAIELIVVLTVALAMYALSTGKIDMLFTGSNVAEEVSDLNTLLANTKSLKTTSGYGTSGTDLTSQLAALNGIPKNMSVVAGVMYNSWGGAVVPQSTGTGFTITTSNYPADVCIKVTTKQGKSGAFSSIKINANAAIVGEVTSATATTQCNTTANTVVYASAS